MCYSKPICACQTDGVVLQGARHDRLGQDDTKLLISLMTLRAYLSGGMEYAENYGADWRKEMVSWLKKELRHEPFDPVAASEKFLKSIHPGVDFRRSKVHDLKTHLKIAKEIVELDSKEIILHSDYLICYYDESAQRGAGTKGELTVARIFGRPVYLVRGMELDSVPSWVLGCVDRIFNDFGELKSFLKEKYST
ncbi:MAG: hypothetical protein M1395_02250 [Bacteroidetes bacterium]|nr:hypothetical protein [Bacteroidota bacterium]